MRPARARTRAAQATDPANADAAYAAALKKLARQPQPRALLDERLRRMGYLPEAVGPALDLAEARGYLNDDEFARSLVRRRASSRGFGLIAQELRARGVDEGAAASALDTLDRQGEAEQAVRLARALLDRQPAQDPRQLRSIIGPKLSRRGFDGGLIHRICGQLSAEWAAAGRFDSPSERD